MKIGGASGCMVLRIAEDADVEMDGSIMQRMTEASRQIRLQASSSSSEGLHCNRDLDL